MALAHLSGVVHMHSLTLSRQAIHRCHAKICPFYLSHNNFCLVPHCAKGVGAASCNMYLQSLLSMFDVLHTMFVSVTMLFVVICMGLNQ